MRSEDGVSEAIGFMIMFALVMTGIGLITLYGYPMLMKEQANANIRNMERNMIVMQNDLKSLTFKNVPYQETDFQVSGGSLSMIAVPGIQKLHIRDNTGSEILGSPFSTNSLRFQSDAEGAVVSLENGAVLLRYQNQPGSVMLAEPRWFYDEAVSPKTMVIPIIRLVASQDMSQTGVGRVRLKITNTTPPITVPDGTVEYEKNLDDDFSVAWTNYFKKTELSPPTSGSGYTIPAGAQIIVKVYDVTVIGL